MQHISPKLCGYSPCWGGSGPIPAVRTASLLVCLFTLTTHSFSFPLPHIFQDLCARRLLYCWGWGEGGSWHLHPQGWGCEQGTHRAQVFPSGRWPKPQLCADNTSSSPSFQPPLSAGWGGIGPSAQLMAFPAPSKQKPLGCFLNGKILFGNTFAPDCFLNEL